MGASGCSAVIPEKQPDLDKCFSAEAEITVGGESITGLISRLSENCWELKISAPFALEGVTVTADDEGTKLIMGDFEASADTSDGTISALRLVADAFEAAADGTGAYENSILNGTASCGAYSFSFGSSGAPESLKLFEHSITVKLSEWTEIEAAAENEDDIQIVE